MRSNQEREVRARALGRLFVSLSGAKQLDLATAAAKAEAYVIAVEGIETDALLKTVEQFVNGLVDDFDYRYGPPNTAQLVRQAAKWQAALHPPVRVPALPEPEPISPAIRRRIGEGLKAHARQLEAEETGRRLAEMSETGRRIHAKTNAVDLGDPRDLHERLNLDRFMRAD